VVILTLGILTFNDSEYLPELLNSIEKQNDKKFKLLIINNSSTDISKSIINSFSEIPHDFDIQVIHNATNIGSFLGTKQLFLNTLTSHLSVIHGDDFLKFNYVEVANRYINLYPDFCAFNFDLEEIEGSNNISTGNIIKSNWTSSKIINRLLVAGLNPGVMPGSIIDVKKLDNNFLNKKFDNSKLNGTEDIFLWQDIIRSSKRIMRVPIKTYFYRRHNSQISKNFNIYGFSLGYARKVNFLTSSTKFEKLLCLSEIAHEFSTVAYDSRYLDGLDNLAKFQKLSIFRFINVFIRRTAKLINYFQ